MTVGRCLLLLGFACLTIMVFIHLAEGPRLLLGVDWGLSDNPGHYVDLVTATLGCGLLIAGVIWISLNARRSG